jgi:iron complex transport system ATP-binding protein
MLEARGLNFSYGKKQILKNVQLTADKGQIISLIGPNGSGKSTLLRCLSGLLPVEKNKIYLFDKSLDSFNSKDIAKKIAFLPQFHEKLSGLTVYDLVAMGRMPYHRSGWVYTAKDKDIIDWAIDYMKISEFKNRDVQMLSGGERQRVWIAMILAQDTPIILLDEPVTYMDLKHQWNMLEIIKNLKNNFQKTVISVFHDINHAIEISDYIYLLENGSIYNTGTPEEVITEKSIHDVFEINAHVCKINRCCKSVVVPVGFYKPQEMFSFHPSNENYKEKTSLK